MVAGSLAEGKMGMMGTGDDKSPVTRLVSGLLAFPAV